MSAAHHACYLPTIETAAIHRQIETWRQDSYPFHVLALLADADRGELPLLQRAFNAINKDLAGAVFPALLHAGEFVSHGVILLRIIDAPRPLLLSGVGTPQAPEATAKALLEHVLKRLADDEEATLFCIFDALTPNIATHLDAWYLQLADRVSYVGINAGNESFLPAPCLFDNHDFIADGLLVQLLPNYCGAHLEHAYGVPERAISATSAIGNRIIQIDWQPALAVYQQLLADEHGVTVTRDNFYQYAVHFPFGILRADGEVLVRIPVALDDQGAIICVGEIPPNSVLALLDARAGINHAVPALLNHAQADHSIDRLLFYCAGRRMHAGDLARDEIAAFQHGQGQQPLFGALTLGEIGGSRSGGYPLFHNAALVDCPWPGR